MLQRRRRKKTKRLSPKVPIGGLKKTKGAKDLLDQSDIPVTFLVNPKGSGKNGILTVKDVRRIILDWTAQQINPIENPASEEEE